MEFARYLAKGRFAEKVGKRGVETDTLVRVVGIPQLAREQAGRLATEERLYYATYQQGVNAYIEAPRSEHPPALRGSGAPVRVVALLPAP